MTRYEPIHALVGLASPILVPALLIIALLCRIGVRVERLAIWAVG